MLSIMPQHHKRIEYQRYWFKAALQLYCIAMHWREWWLTKEKGRWWPERESLRYCQYRFSNHYSLEGHAGVLWLNLCLASELIPFVKIGIMDTPSGNFMKWLHKKYFFYEGWLHLVITLLVRFPNPLTIGNSLQLVNLTQTLWARLFLWLERIEEGFPAYFWKFWE